LLLALEPGASRFVRGEAVGLYRDMILKSLDPRVRGDDGWKETPRKQPTVMPANAGIQGFIAA